MMGWLTLAGVLVSAATAVFGLAKGREKLEAIHVLVNSRLTSVVERVEQLVAVLKEHDIDVPEDPATKGE